MRVISSNMTRMYCARIGCLDAQQLFHGQHIAMLVAHHGDIIETVHVTDTLVKGLALGELFGAAMQQADVRVGPFDDLAVHFQHEAQAHRAPPDAAGQN